MTTVCCSTGKARVYYIIPGKGGLKYKLKGQTKWQTVTAEEPLTSTCTDIPNVLVGGQCGNKYYRLTFAFTDNAGTTDRKYIDIKGKITGMQSVVHYSANGSYNFHFWQVTNDSNQMVEVQCNGYNQANLGGGWNIGPDNLYQLVNTERLDGTSQADDIAQCGGDNPTKKFTVLGESGRKYAEIEVKECPDVQTVDCIFDEKNTKSIDIELPKKTIPWVSLPSSWIPLMNGYKPFITLDSCIKIVDDSIDKAIEIWIVYTAPGSAIEFDPFNLTGWNKKVKSIPYPKGCPPPKAWIECCPNGICGEDKKCPKETVCQVDCEGFRCCYDGKGNLIKKIKL